MFDVNNLNTTATAASAVVANIIENVNQNHHNNNNYNNDNLLLNSSFPYSSSSSTSSYTNSTTYDLQQQNDTNTMLLTDLVVNATAVVVDYASQWLTTTIATTAANLSSISSNETTVDATVSSLLTPTDTILNYTIPTTTLAASYTNSTNSTTFYHHNATTTKTSNDYIVNNNTSTSSSAATFVLNADPNGETPKLADDINYSDELHACDPANPNFNCSRIDYLAHNLGPQALPFSTSLLVTIIYGGIFFTGFFGNVLVCVVIIKHSSMHSVTNYYLFSLAVSDLIYLIFGLPMEVFIHWHQYPYLFGLAFCKARAYISEASTYVSVLTIVAFSVERYLAICHPFCSLAKVGLKRALRIIVLLWIVSFIGAIPFCLYTKIKYLNFPPDQSVVLESGFCGFDTPEEIPVFEVSSLISFFIPMILLFFFYGRMGANILPRATQKLGVQHGSTHRDKSRKAVIRMLAAVVLTFFICWLPFHIQRLWIVHGKAYKYYDDVNEKLFQITGFTYYVSCTINPILYHVMSHRYRTAFRNILCGKRKNTFYDNGFARDQSSFRDNTIATSLRNNSTYDRVHSVRVRSVRIAKSFRDRGSIKSNLWRKSDINTPVEMDIPENHTTTNLSSTNAIVVCVDNGVNGRTKVFTKNEAQKSLLSKNNETCI